MAEPALNYLVEGQGPPLLLVHGFGISFNIWRKLLPRLRPHFTVVMVELPGIGNSPAPPAGSDYLESAIAGIEGVRGALGIERWHVLGYSSGSRIAEAYVRTHALRVCGATFLCPLVIDKRKGRALRLGLRLDRRLPAFGNWILSGPRLGLLISWLGFNLRRDPMSDEWYAEIGAVPVGVLKDTIRAVTAGVIQPFSVPVPNAMIWADRDLIAPAPCKPGQHDYLVHGRHAAAVESAEEVAMIVISFLEKEYENRCEHG